MSELILASASPRRLALLEQIGVKPFAVEPADISETVLKDENPRLYALRMATTKAEKIASLHPDEYVLAADTVVACGRRILPKAENDAEVERCLSMLSGRRHNVYGGICLISPDGRKVTRVVKTAVVFSVLDHVAKQAYLNCGEGIGKAGGYAVQGRAALFVRQIIGSYSNVVGLSLYETGCLLKNAGFVK